MVPVESVPKFMLDGETEIEAAVPVPERLTDCGLPEALSVMDIDAERDPAAAGLKVTLIVHVALTASELPQLLVWPKSVELVPEIAMLDTVSVALPVFVKETACAALLTPTD